MERSFFEVTMIFRARSKSSIISVLNGYAMLPQLYKTVSTTGETSQKIELNSFLNSLVNSSPRLHPTYRSSMPKF
jgi:hypothetical protein